MFELNIGDTPHELSPADFMTLAQQTEGYSGSDIAVIVRDALMQRVRRVLAPTDFRPVRLSFLLHFALGSRKGLSCEFGMEGTIKLLWRQTGSTNILPT